MQCEQAQLYLFDFAANADDLESSLKSDIDQYLNMCDECSALLREIREMELKSTLWTDVEVPGWDRRSHFFGVRENVSWLQLTGAMASVMVLVLVLFRAEFTSNDSGFELSFAGQRDYVSNEKFDSRLQRLESENQVYLQASMNKLADQQIAANQLLLRAMLVANRSERREELGTMMSVWQQDNQYLKESTEDSLRFLLRNQIEGRREINSLTNVLSTITNQQENNL